MKIRSSEENEGTTEDDETTTDLATATTTATTTTATSNGVEASSDVQSPLLGRNLAPIQIPSIHPTGVGSPAMQGPTSDQSVPFLFHSSTNVEPSSGSARFVSMTAPSSSAGVIHQSPQSTLHQKWQSHFNDLDVQEKLLGEGPLTLHAHPHPHHPQMPHLGLPPEFIPVRIVSDPSNPPLEASGVPGPDGPINIAGLVAATDLPPPPPPNRTHSNFSPGSVGGGTASGNPSRSGTLGPGGQGQGGGGAGGGAQGNVMWPLQRVPVATRTGARWLVCTTIALIVTLIIGSGMVGFLLGRHTEAAARAYYDMTEPSAPRSAGAGAVGVDGAEIDVSVGAYDGVNLQAASIDEGEEFSLREKPETHEDRGIIISEKQPESDVVQRISGAMCVLKCGELQCDQLAHRRFQCKRDCGLC